MTVSGRSHRLYRTALIEPSAGPVLAFGADALASDRLKTRHISPWVIQIAIGTLFLVVIALLATYVLRPGRSPADDAQTAEAIRKMDQAQNEANAKRDEQRSATSLL